MQPEKLTIFTDGGARGNPGPAASAFVIQNSVGETIHEEGFYLGQATNNVAEYQGIIFSLEWLYKHVQKHQVANLTFKLDSLLVVNQLKGVYKVKEINLQTLHQSAQQLLQKINIPYQLYHIPRLQNYRADYLVNITLDSQ